MVRQRGGNEPALLYVTADTPPNDVKAWLQSLPKSFPDSREGFVEYLISYCKELFKDVRRTIGRRAGYGSLHQMHQSFEFWNDQKDHLNEKLDRAPGVRAEVVCNLVFLIIFLSQGLLPDTRFSETRRVIEQASTSAGDYINQSERYQKLLPEEYSNAVGDAIQSRLNNLWMLSPHIDAPLVDTSPEIYGEAGPMNSREDTVLTRDSIPGPLHSLKDKFPNASDVLLSRCLAANRQRENNLRRKHAEVDVLHNFSHGSDDNEGPHSVPSKFKALSCSSASTSIVGSSRASRLSSKAHSNTPPTSLSTEANSHGLWQTSSNDSRAQRRSMKCALCNDKLKNSAEYEKHLRLLHVQPYHCCFEDCDDGLPLFSTLREWFDHELQKHRVHKRWDCRDCHDRFDHPISFKNHVSQAHGEVPANKSMDRILEDTLVKAPKFVQGEQCIFCFKGAFENDHDYKSHVGRHMEEIASLVDLGRTLTAQAPSLSFPKYVHKVSQICARMSQALRRIYDVLKRKDQDFELQVMVWDPCEQRSVPREASLDTAATDNFIVSSVVDANHLERHQLPADDNEWETLNGHNVNANDYVVPRWRFSDGKKSYHDIRFIVVDTLPCGIELLLGKPFIKSYELLSLNRHLLVVHRKKAGTVIREGYQQNSQRSENSLYEAERHAAIKAERDNSQAASSQATQTTKLEFQPSQKNPAKSGDAQQK